MGFPRGFGRLDWPEPRSRSGFGVAVLLNRTQEVAGSSPASSMKKKALHEGLFRSASSVENPNEERVAVGALGMTLVEGTEGR
jgi:hypothetical protein